MEVEYLRLVGKAERRETALLSHYGATNRVEFFAVATECFFERPHALREQQAELYAVLRDFYKQDPAEWLPDAASPADPWAAEEEKWRTTDEPSEWDLAKAEEEDCPQWYFAALTSDDCEKLFLMGVECLNEGRNRVAVKAFCASSRWIHRIPRRIVRRRGAGETGRPFRRLFRRRGSPPPRSLQRRGVSRPRGRLPGPGETSVGERRPRPRAGGIPQRCRRRTTCTAWPAWRSANGARRRPTCRGRSISAPRPPKPTIAAPKPIGGWAVLEKRTRTWKWRCNSTRTSDGGDSGRRSVRTLRLTERPVGRRRKKKLGG